VNTLSAVNGRVVILSGPSGVGKDTVLEAWIAADPRVAKVVTSTTRPMRPGETAGCDYDFLTPEQFEAKRKAGDFLEAKNVHGNWYASPREGTDRLINEGRIAVLKIDVQGAIEVMTQLPEAITIFLMPPSREALEARIRGRGTEEESVIARRLADAEGELAEAHRYQHRVVNDNLAQTVRELTALLP